MVKRILLIEGNPTSQDIIASLLAGRGYRVDVASDNFSALECARTADYDVVLIDSQLPEVARLVIRQKMKDGPAPVMLGLTYDRTGPARTIEPGSVFTALLVKPIRPALLFEAIDRVRESKRPALPATAVVPELPPVHRREPDAARDTRNATRALWQSHGLTSHPKAFVCPTPSPDQIVALSLCFEIVDAERAELIVLVARDGLAEARRVAQASIGASRPIIGLTGANAGVCDAIFEVSDPPSWIDVAVLLARPPETMHQARHAPRPAAITAEPDAADHLAVIAQRLASMRSTIERLLRQAPSDAAGERTLLRTTGGLVDDISLIVDEVHRLMSRREGTDARKAQDENAFAISAKGLK